MSTVFLNSIDHPSSRIKVSQKANNSQEAILILGDLYQKTDYAIESLKVVEYVGPKTDVTCYSSNSVRVNIQVYQLHSDTPIEKNDDLPQGEITILPHINFDGRWDE